MLAGIVALFENYPPWIVERAVSPVYGLPKTHKFVPRISEIADFLEAEMAPIRRQQERDSRPLMLPSPPVDRSKRKTYAELQEICARDGLVIGRKKPENRERYARDFRAKHDVPDAVWDAIPDAPVRGWSQMK